MKTDLDLLEKQHLPAVPAPHAAQRKQEGYATTEPSSPEPVLWEETVPGGGHWSGVVRRGTALRLTDLEGGANVSTLFFNFEELERRYNMPDTLKAQHTAYLTRGHVCYSDMGRVLCSITADTVGWHDTVCGLLHAD